MRSSRQVGEGGRPSRDADGVGGPRGQGTGPAGLGDCLLEGLGKRLRSTRSSEIPRRRPQERPPALAGTPTAWRGVEAAAEAWSRAYWAFCGCGAGGTLRSLQGQFRRRLPVLLEACWVVQVPEPWPETETLEAAHKLGSQAVPG